MFRSEPDWDPKYNRRREVVFLVLAGMFLGTLAMLNILGVSRFIDLSFQIFGLQVPFIIFVGVLPYPVTFLCTDLISELYGKKRANLVVWIGLMLNLWVIFIIWIGGILPPVPEMMPDTGLPAVDDPNRVFFEIRRLTFGATTASMVAYLTAQFIDVHVFHFLRNITNGKHLWLRNNGSTFTSQLVDSISVVLITYYYAGAIHIGENENVFDKLIILILSNYFFKFSSALLDTIPFYILTKRLSRYLGIEPMKAHTHVA